MRSFQQLLFPDPRPLVERLGAEFFQSLPRAPGVYLMRDGLGEALYVGKALSLRKRLGCYRVANPDRLPRRHLRLLRLVSRIDVEECASEAAALQREAELLRTLRPRFNRAGTWPSTPRHFSWKFEEGWLWLAAASEPVESWSTRGPWGRKAALIRDALARLLWLAAHPGLGHADLPLGWLQGQMEERLPIQLPADGSDPCPPLESLLDGAVEPFTAWLRGNLAEPECEFQRQAVESEWEALAKALMGKSCPKGLTLSLLGKPVCSGEEVGAASRT